jgi:hypothetical protein
MASGYSRRNQRWITEGGQQNTLSSNALQQSLLGYLSTGSPGQFSATGGGRHAGNPWGGAFPGGMTLEDMGFTGEVVPGAGPMLSQAFDQASGFATSPEYMQRQQMLGSLMQGTPSFSADPELRERYFQQAITDPAMAYYNETVAPSIAARYGRGGNIGAAQQATAQGGADLAGQLAGQRAGLLRQDEVMAYQAQEAARQRQLQAGQMSMVNQAQPLNLLGQYGGLERGIRGEQNQQRLSEAYMAQPFGDPRLSMFSLLGGGMATPGAVSSPSAGGSAGWLGGLGQMLLNPGGGILSSLGLGPVGSVLKSIF